jgi:predicted dehydrogenase
MALGVGIIGTGSIAGHHAKALAAAEGMEARAVLSRREERARSFAEQHGLTAYTDMAALVADERIDAVSICTPSGAHLEPALAAAQGGKHVIVEKPLEIGLDRCDAMIQAAQDAGVVLSTVFQSRFFANAAAAKAAIERGRLGRPVLAEADIRFYRSQEYYDGGGWKGTRALDGGGALMNQGIHALDLLIYLMGPVRRVKAHTATRGHRDIEVEDVAAATVVFADGTLGVIQASTAAYPGFPKRVSISGTDGSITLVEEAVSDWSFREEEAGDEDLRRRLGPEAQSGSGGAADPMAISYEGHKRAFEDVLRAVREREIADGWAGPAAEPQAQAAAEASRRRSTPGQPLVDGREGRKSVELILAIYESARTGREVSLGE